MSFFPPFLHAINPVEYCNQLNVEWLRFITGKIYNDYFKISILVVLCVVSTSFIFYCVFLPLSFKAVGLFPSFSLACSAKIIYYSSS